MNSCVLMAKIIGTPELRYTADNQTPVAEMLVEFAGARSDDPPLTLKVVGWGNLATEIQEKYAEGEQIIVEGRLAMRSIERPEGFKEKRAELVASRIHSLGSDPNYSATASAGFSSSSAFVSSDTELDVPATKTASAVKPTASNSAEENLDDIPF